MDRRYSQLVGVVRIIAGLLFIQHGAEKLWGFAGARIDHNFGTLRAYGGPMEVIGGALLVLGLYTRLTAFILCGEMAVAYFKSWAWRGFFPIQNGGEEAVQFCYYYLWLMTFGSGSWSFDSLIGSSNSGLAKNLQSWEGRARSVLRLIFGFLFTLHGIRLAFGVLPALAGRRTGSPMPLDQLPSFLGYFEIAAGVLLMIGVLTRPVALISAVLALFAYLHSLTNGLVWPVRGGGNETILYALVFGCLALAGGGDWSIDQIFRKARLDETVSAQSTQQVS